MSTDIFCKLSGGGNPEAGPWDVPARTEDFRLLSRGCQTRTPPPLHRAPEPLRPADLEIGDTAGLATCGTLPCGRSGLFRDQFPSRAVERLLNEGAPIPWPGSSLVANTIRLRLAVSYLVDRTRALFMGKV